MECTKEDQASIINKSSAVDTIMARGPCAGQFESTCCKDSFESYCKTSEGRVLSAVTVSNAEFLASFGVTMAKLILGLPPRIFRLKSPISEKKLRAARDEPRPSHGVGYKRAKSATVHSNRSDQSGDLLREHRSLGVQSKEHRGIRTVPRASPAKPGLWRVTIRPGNVVFRYKAQRTIHFGS
ncbi:hypothetical protein CROQUDRAFT_695799 [Cronartium quercuum f. sp. fusiforme G11]|uniref:Uncharacterized protein n=1 Tax=Cronartium quercuum f. sp. fusiforme G11 TaxID=708437 RepID=A0A9P6NPQ1_9BASI|nr:hypothetical protein CROQUDRAFT_695799 [Cronartium quercuum f. sp. fusiforme G11]